MSDDPKYLVPPPEWCNATSVLRAARHMSKSYNRALGTVGLRATQFAILALLAHRGASSIPDIAELLIMDRSNIGHNLRPLERDGLIAVTQGNPDRRRRLIELTDEGWKRLSAGTLAWRKAQLQFEANFGFEQAREMRDIMLRVTETPLDAGTAPGQIAHDLDA